MKYFSALFLSLCIISCNYSPRDNISGNGEVVNTSMDIDSVDLIEVADKIELIHVPSDSFLVVLEADENLHEHIHIKNNDRKLRVYSDRNIRMSRMCRVTVYSDQVVSIKVSSGANYVNRDSVKGEYLRISCSSGGHVRFTGITEQLHVDASSAGEVELAGRCDMLRVSMSSAAELRAYPLMARKAYANLSSAADARIYVTEEAEFLATSAADIRYRGNPAVIRSNANSAGSIKATD